MKRLLSNLTVGFSVLMAVLSASAWLLSYWRHDAVLVYYLDTTTGSAGNRFPMWELTVQSDHGRLLFFFRTTGQPAWPSYGLHCEHYVLNQNLPTNFPFFQFGYQVPVRGANQKSRFIVFPHAVPLIVFAILPAWCCLKRRRNRATRGFPITPNESLAPPTPGPEVLRRPG
jgi:hypothetical protein